MLISFIIYINSFYIKLEKLSIYIKFKIQTKSNILSKLNLLLTNKIVNKAHIFIFLDGWPFDIFSFSINSSNLYDSFLKLSMSILSTWIWYLGPLMCLKAYEEYSWTIDTICAKSCCVICFNLWWNLFFYVKGIY